MYEAFSGKVRDIYDVSDDRFVIVTSDRISAFDVVLPKTVPGKGKTLNAISNFWLDYTNDIVPNHIISEELKDMPEYFHEDKFEGRTTLVRKLKMLPFECVVRGYMFGHMWESYSQNREFCGHKLPEGYKLAQKLEKPIFTPSTKAQSANDEYITFDDVIIKIGVELANKLRDISLKLYEDCYNFAFDRGLIIADAKFEFGLDESGNLVLGDELFTPDCGRFWSAKEYEPGTSPKSYDKQFLRDWLQRNKLDGKMQFEAVPDEILEKTAQIYSECLRLLTQRERQSI